MTIGTARTTRSRVALVRLSCPRTATVACSGTLALARGKIALGKKRFAVAPGRSVRVRVAGRKMRRALRRRSVKVRAVAVTSAPGLLDRTSKRTLVLKRGR